MHRGRRRCCQSSSSTRPVIALLVNVLRVTSTCWMPRLDAVGGVVAERVVADRAAVGAEHRSGQRAERPRAEVHALQVVVEEIAADERRARRALADVVVAVDEEAVAIRCC